MEGGSERIYSAGANGANKVRGPKKVCPECGKRGITSRIKLFRINFEESIYLCSNEKCPFPMTCDPASLIIQRNSKIDTSMRTKSKKRKRQHVPSLTNALTEKPVVPEIVLDSSLDLDKLFNEISIQPPSAPTVTDNVLDSSFDLDNLLGVGSKEDVQDSNVADLAAMLDNLASSAADEAPCPAPSSNAMPDDLFDFPDVFTPPEQVSAEISSAPICDFAASSFSASSALKDSCTNSSNCVGTSENPAQKDTPVLSGLLTEPTSVQNSILPLTATNETPEENEKRSYFTDYTKRNEAEAPCVAQNQTKRKGSRTETRKSTRSKVIPPIQKPNESGTKPVTRNGYLSRLLDDRARLEAASMTKTLAKNPSSDQSSLSQNGSASQVPVSGSQQARPGIQQANAGSQQARPGIQQANQGSKQANPGSKQANPASKQVNQGRQKVMMLPANFLSSLPGIQLSGSGKVQTITLNQEQFAAIQKQFSLQLNSEVSCPTSNSSPSKIADLSAVIQSASALSRRINQDTLTNHAIPSFQGAPTANTVTQGNPTTTGARQTGPHRATKRPLPPQPEPTDTRDDQCLDIFSCMAANPPLKPKRRKTYQRKAPNQPKAPCKRKPKCAANLSVVPDPTITRVNHWLDNQTTVKKQFSGYQPKYLQKAIIQERNGCVSDDSGIQSPRSGRSEESSGPKPIR